ncbi:MAG: ABC transporter permease [Oscillospiraceae bacterium]
MSAIAAFSSRNFKEVVRDPLSYIFCLGFPLVMLVIMTLVNESIPAQVGMTIFRIDNLAGGIAVFGLTFVMLFTCMGISKDRTGAFLTRLYASPMRSADFILGYTAPMFLLCVIQIVITFIASFIVSLITGVELSAVGLLLSLAALLPSALMMTGFGLLFGSLFGEKAAPGLCSIVISLASFLGGVWFDADSTGGVLLDICRVLPFYHSTRAARAAAALDFETCLPSLLITLAYMAAVMAAAIAVFRIKMRADAE